MKERKKGNRLPIQEQVAKAMRQYKELLEHYDIDQAVQGAVWTTVFKDFENNPRKTVREIQGYWETTFGVNGKTRANSKQGTKSLNERRQKWRNESFAISKEGNVRKAKKKAIKKSASYFK